MSQFSEQTLETLRERAGLLEVVNAYVRLRRSGRNHLGLCPFHNERTPSFTVNPERGFFHCFGCGAGGTVFNFVMRAENLSFPEAVRLLASRYGVTLETGKREERALGERDAIYHAGEFARAFFAKHLWESQEGKAAREYLAKRAITEKTAREFKLGFAPPAGAALTASARKAGLLEGAVKVGLARSDGADGLRDMFRGRLMFPIHDAQGRVIAFGGRALDDGAPKYLNSPESPVFSKARTLFGLESARRAIVAADRAIVVEGYIDALTLCQAGFREAVATLGTALTAEHLRTLRRYTSTVLACFDGDDAGQSASVRALPVFLGAGIPGRAVFLPRGFDPDKLVVERGAQAFASLLDRAEPLVIYFAKQEARRARGSLEGRAVAARRVAEMLSRVRDPFEFDLLARSAAQILGVDEQILRRQGGAGRAIDNAGATPVRVVRSAAQIAQAHLLAIALLYPELRPEIFGLEALRCVPDKGLADVVLDVCRAEEKCDVLLPLLSSRLSQEQMRTLIEQLAATDSIVDKPSHEHIYKFKIPEFEEVNEAKWRNDTGARRLGLVARERETVQQLAKAIVAQAQGKTQDV